MPLVYLDTSVFIHGFETRGSSTGLLRALLVDLEKYPLAAVTSALTLAELLAPIKNAAAMTMIERKAIYLPLFDPGSFIEIAPITLAILLETASLRQAHPQRLADAIHMSTAVDSGCRFFMSPDRDARRLPPSLTWIEPDATGIATVLDALRG